MSTIYYACYRGDLAQVKMLISQDNINYNMGLWGACERGHRELVDLMLMLGATNYDTGLENACEDGNLDIVFLLINKGGSISSLNGGTIVQLLNIGLDPKLKHISTNKHIKQKVRKRKRAHTNAERILNNYVPKDIIQHVFFTYIRYE
jgi:hypothetical protein